MTDREDRLRSLLDKVRAKRPGERETHAAEAVDRIRAGSGTMAAASEETTLSDPPTSPHLESPTRYSSQPPRVERPLSVEPRARSAQPPSRPAEPPSQSPRPASIRAQSVAPSGQPVVYATDQPEFPRPKTFGELLELTLSLRPR
jgi:hypothetical protein